MSSKFKQLIPLQSSGEYFHLNEHTGAYAYKGPRLPSRLPRDPRYAPSGVTGHIRDIEARWDTLNPSLKKAYTRWRDAFTSTSEGIERYNQFFLAESQ